MSNFPQPGESFRDFVIGEFGSANAREGKPLMIVIWRTGCSTCRFSLPYFERILKAYPEASIYGVSQDSSAETEAYCQEYAISIPQQIDQDLKVTRSFDVRVVPTYVLVDASGRVIFSGYSWSRENVEDMSRALAKELGKPYVPIVHDSDQAPAFKPG